MKLVITMLGLMVLLMHPLGIRSDQHFHQKLITIQNNLKYNRQQIQAKQAKKQAILTDILHIDRDIHNLGQQAHALQNQLKVHHWSLQQAMNNHHVLTENYKHQQAILAKRLVRIYKNKDMGVLSLVFLPDQLSDWAHWSYFMERLVQSDVDFMEDMKTDFSRISTNISRLAQKKTGYRYHKTTTYRQ